MQKKPSLYLDRGTSLGKRERIIISSEGLSSTRNESLRHLSEASLLNIKGIKKCSAKRSHRGCLGIPFGITLSSCSQEHLPTYLDDFFLLFSAYSPKSHNPYRFTYRHNN